MFYNLKDETVSVFHIHKKNAKTSSEQRKLERDKKVNI